jgi:hypothetical protein
VTAFHFFFLGNCPSEIAKEVRVGGTRLKKTISPERMLLIFGVSFFTPLCMGGLLLEQRL